MTLGLHERLTLRSIEFELCEYGYVLWSRTCPSLRQNENLFRLVCWYMGGVCFRDETMLSFDRMEVSSAWYSSMFFRDKNSPLLDRMKVGLAYFVGIGLLV